MDLPTRILSALDARARELDEIAARGPKSGGAVAWRRAEVAHIRVMLCDAMAGPKENDDAAQ